MNKGVTVLGGCKKSGSGGADEGGEGRVKKGARELGLREKLYCHWLEATGSPRQAAKLAGYSTSGGAVLEAERERQPALEEYREKIRQVRKRGLLDMVEEGYRKLAFGSIGDAVRLMFTPEAAVDWQKLDLYNLSEIRQVKGAVEMKFFSRPEALGRLLELEGSRRSEGEDFYTVLRQSAEALERKKEAEPERK